MCRKLLHMSDFNAQSAEQAFTHILAYACVVHVYEQGETL